MKTIAALTMVFLPGTFLASVFSMPMLEDAKLSLYVAIVVPLTVAVVGCWWLWLSGPRLFRQLMRKRHKVKDVQRMVWVSCVCKASSWILESGYQRVGSVLGCYLS
jgi:membrane protein DedA with SNARE-associated domain